MPQLQPLARPRCLGRPCWRSLVRPQVNLPRRALVVGAAAADSQQQQASPVASAPPPAAAAAPAVVRAFYEAYNARDLAAIEQLIADDIEYSDLVYEEPHEGRAGVMAWLRKVRRYAPDDLKFVIEDITGDARKAGVMWHVECGEGIDFPFSRGCSFITLDASGKILTVRDVVEPAVKPGDSTLQLLGSLTPLIRSLGPGGADPARLKRLPIAAAAVWALYVGYLALVMLSDAVPGPPAVATPPEVLLEVFQESVNIFFINDALTALHLSFIPSMPSPPVSEAVFNFVIAWAVMFLPVMLTDGPSAKVDNKRLWFAGCAFLTNVFFIPFMALRAMPEPLQQPQPGAASTPAGASASRRQRLRPRKVPVPGSQALPMPWARALGALGGGMGLLCIAWAFVGRPEAGGDLAARWEYLTATLASNRVFWAFWLDMLLFWAWQLSFLQAAPARYRLVPYFGLAAWLLAGGTQPDDEAADA